MMSLRNFLLPMLLVASSLVFGQSSEYNLPPGYRLNSDKVIYDLSGKLTGEDSRIFKDQELLFFLKNPNEVRLEDTSEEYQEYVREGNQFINGLSASIKAKFTVAELWYIYAFDDGLKTKLLKYRN